MEEIYRTVENSVYMVSDCGRVKNTKTGRILKPHKTRKGYLRISIRINNKKSSQLVHRLVAMAFIDNPYNKPEVNHLNGIKTDNNVLNLAWSTSEENNHHSWEIGLRDIEKYREHLKRVRVNSKSRLVLNTEIGIYYDTAKEAVASLNIKITVRSVCNQLNGKYRNNTPFIYA